MYYTPCFDIKDYFDDLSKMQEFQAKKALVEDWMQTRGFGDDDYRKKMESGEVMRDMPTQEGEGCCAGKVPLNLDTVNEGLEEYKAKVEGREDEANSNEASAEVRQSKFTGTIVIVCKKQSEMYTVLNKQRNGCCWTIIKMFCGCCLEKDDYWMFERAPEPSDINWENMGLTFAQACFRQLVSVALTLVMLAGSFLLIWRIKMYAKNELADILAETGDCGYDDPVCEATVAAKQLLNQNLSVITAMIVAVINAIMPLVMRQFSLYERLESKTSMSLTLAFKLSLLKFLNTSVIYAIVHDSAESWFKSGDLITDVFSVLIFAVGAPIINLCTFLAMICLQRVKICCADDKVI